MPYAHKVTRVTINGTCFAGAEHWSTGFFMGSVGADSLDPTAAGAAAVGAAWQTFVSNIDSGVHQDYKTTGVKIATLDTAGQTVNGSPVYWYPSSPFGGATGGSPFPAQISLVATLATDTPRGLGSKGRMYLPGVTKALGVNGKISSSAADQIATTLASFFTAINGQFDLTGSVITASKGSTPPLVGPGVARMVTSVRVGDVYDTQRRRRNELVEQYSTAAVSA